MPSKSIFKTSLLAGVAGFCLAMAGAAQAGVESMHSPRDPERNCNESHEVSAPGQIWTPAEGVLRVHGNGPEQFEFYGQGVDPFGAEINDLRGASAVRKAGHAGFINAARGCGNIGSIVVELSFPTVTRDTPGTIEIGPHRIPFIVAPRKIESAFWDNANVDSSTAERGSGGSGSGSTSVPASRPITTSKEPDCTGPGCPAPGGGVRIVGSYGSGGAPGRPSPPPVRTYSSCMDEFGGLAELSGGRLTVTVPRDRPSDCFSRYFLAIAPTRTSAHAHLMGGANVFNVAYAINNPSDGPRLTGRPEPYSGSMHYFNLPPAEFQALVGEYRYTIGFSPAQGTAQLELILKSDPVYGVERIISPPTRTTDASGLTVTPYQPVKAGQRFFWRITSPTAGLADRCFSDTSGTIAPPAGAASFVLPPTASSFANCRETFSVVVKPAMFETDPRYDTLFGKVLAFRPGINVTPVLQDTRPPVSRGVLVGPSLPTPGGN